MTSSIFTFYSCLEHFFNKISFFNRCIPKIPNSLEPDADARGTETPYKLLEFRNTQFLALILSFLLVYFVSVL